MPPKASTNPRKPGRSPDNESTRLAQSGYGPREADAGYAAAQPPHFSQSAHGAQQAHTRYAAAQPPHYSQRAHRAQGAHTGYATAQPPYYSQRAQAPTTHLPDDNDSDLFSQNPFADTSVSGRPIVSHPPPQNVDPDYYLDPYSAPVSPRGSERRKRRRGTIAAAEEEANEEPRFEEPRFEAEPSRGRGKRTRSEVRSDAAGDNEDDYQDEEGQGPRKRRKAPDQGESVPQDLVDQYVDRGRWKGALTFGGPERTLRWGRFWQQIPDHVTDEQFSGWARVLENIPVGVYSEHAPIGESFVTPDTRVREPRILRNHPFLPDFIPCEQIPPIVIQAYKNCITVRGIQKKPTTWQDLTNRSGGIAQYAGKGWRFIKENTIQTRVFGWRNEIGEASDNPKKKEPTRGRKDNGLKEVHWNAYRELPPFRQTELVTPSERVPRSHLDERAFMTQEQLNELNNVQEQSRTIQRQSRRRRGESEEGTAAQRAAQSITLRGGTRGRARGRGRGGELRGRTAIRMPTEEPRPPSTTPSDNSMEQYPPAPPPAHQELLADPQPQEGLLVEPPFYIPLDMWFQLSQEEQELFYQIPNHQTEPPLGIDLSTWEASPIEEKITFLRGLKWSREQARRQQERMLGAEALPQGEPYRPQRPERGESAQPPVGSHSQQQPGRGRSDPHPPPLEPPHEPYFQERPERGGAYRHPPSAEPDYEPHLQQQPRGGGTYSHPPSAEPDYDPPPPLQHQYQSENCQQFEQSDQHGQYGLPEQQPENHQYLGENQQLFANDEGWSMNEEVQDTSQQHSIHVQQPELQQNDGNFESRLFGDNAFAEDVDLNNLMNPEFWQGALGLAHADGESAAMFAPLPANANFSTEEQELQAAYTAVAPAATFFEDPNILAPPQPRTLPRGTFQDAGMHNEGFQDGLAAQQQYTQALLENVANTTQQAAMAAVAAQEHNRHFPPADVSPRSRTASSIIPSNDMTYNYSQALDDLDPEVAFDMHAVYENGLEFYDPFPEGFDFDLPLLSGAQDDDLYLPPNNEGYDVDPFEQPPEGLQEDRQQEPPDNIEDLWDYPNDFRPHPRTNARVANYYRDARSNRVAGSGYGRPAATAKPMANRIRRAWENFLGVVERDPREYRAFVGAVRAQKVRRAAERSKEKFSMREIRERVRGMVAAAA